MVMLHSAAASSASGVTTAPWGARRVRAPVAAASVTWFAVMRLSRVRDASGATPLGYLPDQLDPTGRQVSLNIRKLF